MAHDRRPMRTDHKPFTGVAATRSTPGFDHDEEFAAPKMYAFLVPKDCHNGRPHDLPSLLDTLLESFPRSRLVTEVPCPSTADQTIIA